MPFTPSSRIRAGWEQGERRRPPRPRLRDARLRDSRDAKPGHGLRGQGRGREPATSGRASVSEHRPPERTRPREGGCRACGAAVRLSGPRSQAAAGSGASHSEATVLGTTDTDAPAGPWSVTPGAPREGPAGGLPRCVSRRLPPPGRAHPLLGTPTRRGHRGPLFPVCQRPGHARGQDNAPACSPVQPAGPSPPFPPVASQSGKAGRAGVGGAHGPGTFGLCSPGISCPLTRLQDTTHRNPVPHRQNRFRGLALPRSRTCHWVTACLSAPPGGPRGLREASPC